MMQPAIHRFGKHDLQEIAVWARKDTQASLFWVVLIHGGAWRDPTITHRTFAESAVSILLSSDASSPPPFPVPKGKALAVASLSYRLSPHPSYPQDPNTTPETSFRGAQHPDHLDDVCSGLGLLAQMYPLTEDNYIVVGHSCGATLAFQAFQRLSSSTLGIGEDGYPTAPTRLPPPPAAIVGMAGIYDLRLLLSNHRDGPYGNVYASFIEGAFGKDMRDWDRASPASDHFDWKAEKTTGVQSSPEKTSQAVPAKVLLVTADGDELLEPEQRTVMSRTLKHLGGTDCSEMSVEGGHDEMWLRGERMVAAIERVLAD